jgi:purine-nucleoside/S-methyl-5'-thioadenosine phosphorylase / adenosine deaminase
LARVRFSSRADGDARRWLPESGAAWCEQVHGTGVVVVDHPGFAGEGDALVTTVPGLPVAVRCADCGPLVLTRDGAVAAVHVGWHGLLAGIVHETIDVLGRHGSGPIEGTLGPCIAPCCYEFGVADLALVAAEFGGGCRGTTSDGRPALDLRAAIAAACEREGVAVSHDGRCTAHETDDDGAPVFYSHRARGDEERQAVLAWLL